MSDSLEFKQAVDYIVQYGGRCRDCGDENGVCPTTKLPCAHKRAATEYVLKALGYGIEHGFVANPFPLRAGGSNG